MMCLSHISFALNTLNRKGAGTDFCHRYTGAAMKSKETNNL